MKIRIWAQCYRPFMMGGNVHRPIACKENAKGPFPLGQGIKGYVVVSPNGTTHIAEATTGGLVGETLEEVREAIGQADKKTNMNTIKINVERGKDAEMMTAKQFWKLVGEDVAGEPVKSE